MAVTFDLLAQFAKATTPKKESKNETTAYGTYVKYNGSDYVQLDGSDLLTPVSKTTNAKDGDRVTVTIKNHSAIADGNLSSPSATNTELQETGSKITEFEIVVADKVSTEELEAERARIDTLVSTSITTETLTAELAEIGVVIADLITTEKLEAEFANIDTLVANKVSAEIATFDFAEISDLEATNARIYDLEGTYATFVDATAGHFRAIDADIADLTATTLTAESADIRYADIDFANVGSAAIETLFANSGVFKDFVISEGNVTGKLVSVEINGDLITAGTLIADKLVIQGTDGLYYKLNTDGAKITAEEQTIENALHGSVIIAQSITANKINVDDLVAFDATIGGFHISENSIYSGIKESVDNTTTGMYFGEDGEFAVGDSDNYVKYYKDANGEYKLAITVDSLLFSVGTKNVNEFLSDKIAQTQIGARNFIRNSTTLIFRDYYFSTAFEATYDGDDRITIVKGASGFASGDGSLLVKTSANVTYSSNKLKFV